jgi:hypothetical protein
MTLKHDAAILMVLFMEQTYANNFNSEPYTLPPNKVCLDNCQKGNIVEEILHR